VVSISQTQLYLLSYLMEVASNYMFRPMTYARDLYVIVTRVFALCTQLLLRYYVQPDDGHHKGRNM